jgi:hypothetical protein
MLASCQAATLPLAATVCGQRPLAGCTAVTVSDGFGAAADAAGSPAAWTAKATPSAATTAAAAATREGVLGMRITCS